MVASGTAILLEEIPNEGGTHSLLNILIQPNTRLSEIAVLRLQPGLL